MLRWLILVSLLFASSAQAESPRVVDWQALVPDHAPLVDPLDGVPMSVRFDLGFAAQVLSDARAGVIAEGGPEHNIAMGVLESLKARGMDADRLVHAFANRDAELEARRSATVPAVDGAFVRIAGYALPLGASDEGVSEFLLVPYVGACIHYPPPPANQMVLASLATPHRFEDRFEAVWITGHLAARSAQQSLDYVDGAANVQTSYRMEVLSVTPYSEDPSAKTAMGSFSKTAQGPELKLSRTGLPHPPIQGGTQ